MTESKEVRVASRPRLGAVCVVVSAAALVLSSPDFGDLWWLLPVALVPMIVAQYGLLPRQGGIGRMEVMCSGVPGRRRNPAARYCDGVLAVLLSRPFNQNVGRRVIDREDQKTTGASDVGAWKSPLPTIPTLRRCPLPTERWPLLPFPVPRLPS